MQSGGWRDALDEYDQDDFSLSEDDEPPPPHHQRDDLSLTHALPKDTNPTHTPKPNSQTHQTHKPNTQTRTHRPHSHTTQVIRTTTQQTNTPPPGLNVNEPTSPDQNDIDTLTDMGFSVDAAIDALRAAGNSIDAAIEKLLISNSHAQQVQKTHSFRQEPISSLSETAALDHLASQCPPGLRKVTGAARSQEELVSASHLPQRCNMSSELPDVIKSEALKTSPTTRARRVSPPRAMTLPELSSQLNLVILGHVDAGKSTMVGRLLQICGRVDARSVHKSAREAEIMGKSSFALAFLLDHMPEERERGVTIEASCAHFEIGNLLINVLDAPGHKDFVPAMIGAASQADAAMLVINASTGELQTGEERSLEHLRVARCLGVSEVLVAVNKMDTSGYSSVAFKEAVSTTSKLLNRAGFDAAASAFVPVSALQGIGFEEGSSRRIPGDWYHGACMFDAIQQLKARPRDSIMCTRLCINDVFTGSHGMGGTVVTGTLQAGSLSLGQRLVLMPSADQVTLLALRSRGEVVRRAVAGDHVEITITSTSAADLIVASGSVLCDDLRPISDAVSLELSLRTFEPRLPLLPGSPCELFLHTDSCGAVLSSITCSLGSRGERLTSSRPRALGPNCSALVRIDLERSVCVDEFAHCKSTGRVVLRDRGRVVAAGVVNRHFNARYTDR